MDKFYRQALDINATDCPIRITNRETKESKVYLVESLAWNLATVNNQEVLEYVFNNFPTEAPAFDFKRDEFQWVVKAFREESPISEMVKSYTIDYLHKGLHTTARIGKNCVSLQFCGWEIVLLEDGHYYINDTSGG